LENLRELLTLYLSHCRYEIKLSLATLKAYSIDLNQLISYLSHCPEQIQIDKNIIRRYLQKLFEDGLKETSIRRKMISSNSFFTFLEDENYIPLNPFHNLRIKLKLKRKLPEIMNLDEVKILLAAPRNNLEELLGIKTCELTPGHIQSYQHVRLLKDIVILEMLFATAARVSELCSLKISDIDLVRNVIKVVGKGSVERMIAIPNEEVRNLISLYRDVGSIHSPASQWLLTNRLGRRMNPQSVRTIIHKYCTQAKLSKRITPHLFRHTTATMLLENGTDIRIVQMLLGHSSISTTQIYTHVSNSAQQRIITMNHPRNRF